MNPLVYALPGYLLGSLPFAVIVSKAFGLADPRSFGSGNPGATNVLRSGHKAAALLTLLGDAAKGWLAVWLSLRYAADFGLDEMAVAACALAVFLGHVYPVFFGFHGGKGVATALGILVALNGWLGLALLATWLAATLIWRISSLSALLAALCAPLYGWFMLPSKALFGAAAVLSLLLIWRHQSNIRNLLSGRESAIGKGQ